MKYDESIGEPVTHDFTTGIPGDGHEIPAKYRVEDCREKNVEMNTEINSV